MDIGPFLLELYGRIPPLAADAVERLSAEELAWAPEPGANSVGWLVWHLTRVLDHHVAELLDEPQIWASGTWAQRCGLEPDPSNTGYGHNTDEARAVRPDSPDALLGYLREVEVRTNRFLGTVTAADLDRVVDRRWEPPVTLGVRLVSIADDCLQHGGQAAYVRGLIEREQS